jgi:hypothetical protein
MLIASSDIDDDAKEEEPAMPVLAVKAVSSFIHKADKLAEMDVNIDLRFQHNTYMNNSSGIIEGGDFYPFLPKL